MQSNVNIMASDIIRDLKRKIRVLIAFVVLLSILLMTCNVYYTCKIKSMQNQVQEATIREVKAIILDYSNVVSGINKRKSKNDKACFV